jgi:hypothetical protein
MSAFKPSTFWSEKIDRKTCWFIGFACGFTYSYWWWEYPYSSMTIAIWIAMHWQLGDFKFQKPN